jgi:hypothetical protein
MTTKVVAGFVMAGIASTTFFTLLRKGLLATGIGILVVGLGEILLAFNQLAIGAGSLANAFSLVYNVIAEVSLKIKGNIDELITGLLASWYDYVAGIADAIGEISPVLFDFANNAIGIFTGSFEAIKIIWSALPAAISDFTIQAANSLISGVESMLNAVVERINAFIVSLNSALALLPSWATGEGGISLGALASVDLGSITNPLAGAAADAGKAVGDAFNKALSTNYIAPTLFSDFSKEAKAQSDAYEEAGRMLSKTNDRSITSMEALKEAFAKGETDTNGLDPSSWLVEDTGDKKGSGGGGKDATDNALEKLREQLALEKELIGTSESYQRVRSALGEDFVNTSPKIIEGLIQQADEIKNLTRLEEERQSLMDSINGSLETGFMAMVKGTQTVGEAFKTMAAAIIEELFRVLVVKKLVEGVTNVLGGGTFTNVAGLTGGGRASGGSMMAGGSYLVGENGPELVVPRHSGTVVNANQTSGAMAGSGGITVQNNITVTGSDAAMVRQEVAKMIPQITNATKAAVIDAKQRGGQMAQAFR